ncbi:putative ferric reductase transmembrane component [Emericellopsis atlantica]|uniref:ferric-chelate reductase (NADPH) n=1 Tax=Emericellopsis atlantica TaxID=2614577 RepID=A0A9P7ZHD9_9HYPO|nr:putative ferric reductase transmembrane component [Emericellopsis atlantica]KAG9251872.1 putative ferric reductase transmembrane component [Emericellopsis atlantica]
MSLPWLSQPVMLHSSRDPGMCMLTPEQCAYKQRYWVFWYEADHRYSLPTLALFLSTIIVFAVVHALDAYGPDSWTQSKLRRRAAAATRWASYRRWRVGSWSTQSLGTYMLGFVGFVFFTVMTLAPQPYYWPNTKDVSYGHSPPIAMALACLPFILVLATKANLIASLIGTSHENLIVWHNWIAWAMLVLALIHTFPFVVQGIQAGDIVEQWNTGGLWVTGVIALVAQAWLTFFSIRWLRERYYEIFKMTHFLAALVFVLFFFLHCDGILTSWDYFIAAATLYAASWLYSQCRVYLEYGLQHKARLTLEGAETLKIAIDTTAEWTPGQHVYLRFLTLGLHTLSSHPFTICSLPVSRYNGKNQMVFYVKGRGGLTGRLAKMAQTNPGTTVRVLLDGPYGGMQSRWYSGFDHAVVIAGGAGAGFTLGLFEDFVTRSQLPAAAAQDRKLTLVLSSRDLELKRWYLDAIAALLDEQQIEEGEEKKEARRLAGLTIHIHHTGIANSRADSSEDNSLPAKDDAAAPACGVVTDVPTSLRDVTTNVAAGRPDITSLCREIIAAERGSVGLVVCGPASMVHDVGHVAASAQTDVIKGGSGASEVWFHKESFSS